MAVGLLLRRSVLLQAAGMALAAGGAAYYFTHPPRVTVDLPPSLVAVGRDVWLTAEDGIRLHAYWLGGRGERTIVQHHGFASCGGLLVARNHLVPPRWRDLAMLREAAPVTAWPLVEAGLARGYNFLLIDARAHGRSAGRWDPDGRLLAADLMAWVRWLRETHGQLWVGLWGNSMGAAVGLYLATRPASGGFDAMVLDSTPVSPQGIYEGVIGKPFYWAVQPVIGRLGRSDLVERLRAGGVSVPILLIHGQQDRHVPAWHSQQVYEMIRDGVTPPRAELWLVPGADHLTSLEVMPEMYVRQTLDWFDRWFGQPQKENPVEQISA